MKVVLTKDIPRIGQKNDIKEISDGYAKNFLFPRGLAKIATDKTIQQAKLAKKLSDAQKQKSNEVFLENIEKLKEARIIIIGKVNEQGHLFAGIHKEEIVKEVKKQLGVELEANALQIEKPIKEIGEHKITIQAGDKKSTFNLVIEEEE